MKEKQRNLLLTLKYDGTAYHGFQIQNNAVTVSGAFQKALKKVFREPIDVKGCSRTDTGVHALAYKLSMIVSDKVPVDRIPLTLNRVLPQDIAVINTIEVPMNFHARYHVVSKEYIYRVNNSRTKDPFTTNYQYHFPWKLDSELLDREARAFVGTHDFSAFCSDVNPESNNVRTIKELQVTRTGDQVEIRIQGDGFLYNMVRIIVGTLLEIGSKKIIPGEIPAILESKDRRKSGNTAPAHGLYLTQVYYADDWGVEI